MKPITICFLSLRLWPPLKQFDLHKSFPDYLMIISSDIHLSLLHMRPTDGQLSAFPLVSLWPCLWWLIPAWHVWCDDDVWVFISVMASHQIISRPRVSVTGQWIVTLGLWSLVISVAPGVILLINAAENHVFALGYTNMFRETEMKKQRQ